MSRRTFLKHVCSDHEDGTLNDAHRTRVLSQSLGQRQHHTPWAQTNGHDLRRLLIRVCLPPSHTQHCVESAQHCAYKGTLTLVSQSPVLSRALQRGSLQLLRTPHTPAATSRRRHQQRRAQRQVPATAHTGS